MSLADQDEVSKVRSLAFYFLRIKSKIEFDLKDVTEWFDELGFAKPNTSRLRDKIRSSRSFIRGNGKDTYKLHVSEIAVLDAQYPDLTIRTDDIVAPDTILPEALYRNTPEYLNSLAKQINGSYSNNYFDGCAVLMRRLLEILLILSYKNLGIESAIKETDGNYKLFERIADDAKTNSTLDLSRNTKSHLDIFRSLGNFSAHKIYYTCKRSSIERIILEYVAIIEELQYKSGIRK